MRAYVSPSGEVRRLDDEEWAHDVLAGQVLGMTREQVYTEVVRHWTNEPREKLHAEVYRLGWVRLSDPSSWNPRRRRTAVVTAREEALVDPAWRAVLAVVGRERCEVVELCLVGEDGKDEVLQELCAADFRARRWESRA